MRNRCNKTHLDESIWHMKLGHPAPLILRKVMSHLHLKYDHTHTSFCDACKLGKLHQLPFQTSTYKAEKVLDLVYIDVWGPSPISSLKYHKYYVILMFGCNVISSLVQAMLKLPLKQNFLGGYFLNDTSITRELNICMIISSKL